MNTNLLILADFLLFYVLWFLIGEFGNWFDKIIYVLAYVLFLYFIW
jgi:hypothetical protein